MEEMKRKIKIILYIQKFNNKWKLNKIKILLKIKLSLIYNNLKVMIIN